MLWMPKIGALGKCWCSSPFLSGPGGRFNEVDLLGATTRSNTWHREQELTVVSFNYAVHEPLKSRVPLSY